MNEASDTSSVVSLQGWDEEFENQCIDLMCKQENALANFGEGKRRAMDSPELARKILLQFLDFAEEHFSKTPLERVEQRLVEIHQRMRDYEQLVSAQSFKTVKKWVGVSVPDAEEAKTVHEELFTNYADLFNEFFNECSKRFAESSNTREPFLQSVEAFLSELRKKW